MTKLTQRITRRQTDKADAQIAAGEAQYYLGLEAKRQRLLTWLQGLRTALQAEATQQNGGPTP